MNERTAESPANLSPEQEEIKIVGHVVVAPDFEDTPQGLKATIIVGVPGSHRHSYLHLVMAFNQEAENLQGHLSKGDKVQAVGSIHVVDAKPRRKNSPPRKAHQFHASSVMIIEQ